MHNVAVKCHPFSLTTGLVLRPEIRLKSSDIKSYSSFSRSFLLLPEYCLAVGRKATDKSYENFVFFYRKEGTAVCVFTLMKQRRIYFSNCFLDSSPTKAVTGMAASFCTKYVCTILTTVMGKRNMTAAMWVCIVGSKIEQIQWHHLFFNHPLHKLVVIGFVISHVWKILIYNKHREDNLQLHNYKPVKW